MAGAASSLKIALGAVAWGTALAVNNPGYDAGARVTFDEVIPGFGGGTEGFPESNDYLLHRVLPPALPGFVLALFFFVYLVLFIMLRTLTMCCCNRGFCRCFCGTVTIDEQAKRPSKAKRCMQFFAVLLAIGICAPACGIGITGAKHVSDGITDLADTIEREVQQTYDMAVLTDSAVRTFDASFESELEPLVKDVQSSVNKVVDAMRTGLESDWVKPMVYCFYGIFLAVPMLGVASYCCQRGCLAVVMTALALFCLVITWAIFGASFLTAIVVNDTCLELTKFYNFEPNAVPASWCVDTEQAQQSYTKLHSEAEQALLAYSTLGFTPNISSLSEAELANGTESGRRFAANQQWRFEVRQDLGVETSSPEDYSATVVPGGSSCIPLAVSGLGANQTCLQQAIATGADGMTASSFVGSCYYVSSLAEAVVPGDGLCTDTLNGFVLMFVAHGLIGLAFTILLCVGLRAQQDWQDWESKQSRV